MVCPILLPLFLKYRFKYKQKIYLLTELPPLISVSVFEDTFLVCSSRYHSPAFDFELNFIYRMDGLIPAMAAMVAQLPSLRLLLTPEQAQCNFTLQIMPYVIIFQFILNFIVLPYLHNTNIIYRLFISINPTPLIPLFMMELSSTLMEVRKNL